MYVTYVYIHVSAAMDTEKKALPQVVRKGFREEMPRQQALDRLMK